MSQGFTHPINIPIPVAQGGTGGTTAASARTNLGAAASGANGDITSMTGLSGTIQAPTAISSSAGLPLLALNYTASAVNYFAMTSSVTAAVPVLDATGSDAAVPFGLRAKNSNFYFVDSTTTIAPAIRLYNAAASHYTGLKVATAAATDLTLTLPSADGVANAPLVTDASGVLSFGGTFTDISGSITVNGFSGSPTVIMRQCLIGKIVHITFAIVGTSNSTSFTVTGMPKTINATLGTLYVPILITNNGTNATGLMSLSGTTITFYLSMSSNVWTNSGAKSAYGSFFYEST